MSETDARQQSGGPSGGTDWKPAVAAAVFSLIGALSGSFLTYSAARYTAQNEFSEKFAQSINESLPHLRDPRDGGMSFAGLFTLAQTQPQKRALITIGVNADTEAIRCTLASLIGSGENVALIARESSTRRFIMESMERGSARRAEAAQLRGKKTLPREVLVNIPDDSSLALPQTLAPVNRGYILFKGGSVESRT